MSFPEEAFTNDMVINYIITAPDGDASVEAAVQAMETYKDVTKKVDNHFVAGMLVPPRELLPVSKDLFFSGTLAAAQAELVEATFENNIIRC